MCILDLSKCMISFKIILERSIEEKQDWIFADADSLTYEIETGDVYITVITRKTQHISTKPKKSDKDRNITPPLFLLPLLEYISETFQKLLFRNNKTSYGSPPSRYHNRYYITLMPFTKLFHSNRKNAYLGLQKDACTSKYRQFQT